MNNTFLFILFGGTGGLRGTGGRREPYKGLSRHMSRRKGPRGPDKGLSIPMFGQRSNSTTMIYQHFWLVIYFHQRGHITNYQGLMSRLAHINALSRDQS